MAKNEKSGKRVTRIASKLLGRKSTPKKAKSVSGSVLTQAPDKPKVTLKKKPSVRKKK